MPEKIAIISGSIMAFLTAALTIFMKVKFVSKSQMFDKNGRPLFRYAISCDEFRNACADRTCLKITELKDGQKKVVDELKLIKELLVRVDQKVIDHEKWNGENRRKIQ